MEFNYYYGSEADQFSFIRIPKTILIDEAFASLSLGAKLLYGLLLDRMGLSMKNKWLDEENRVYIIYQIAEIQEDLGLSKKKAIDYLGELERFGLVEKKRRGLGLPSILYVKSFITIQDELENEEAVCDDTLRDAETGTSSSAADERDIAADDAAEAESEEQFATSASDSWTNDADDPAYGADDDPRSVDSGTSRGANSGTSRSVDLGTSRGVISELQEVPISTPLNNNTKTNNNYRSDTKSNPILSEQSTDAMDEIRAYAAIIKENIEYESLLAIYPRDAETVDGLFDLILETVISKAETIHVAGSEYPKELVKSKFLKLDFSHLQYVIECFLKNTTKVVNIKKYLLAMLFNAPSTIGSYYQAEVNHDMPQFAKA